MVSSKFKIFIFAVLLSVSPALAEPPASRMDFITHNQILVQAPSDIVWTHALRVNDWKKGASLKPQGKEPDRLGARFEAIEDGRPAGWVAENVEFVPEQVRTLRLNHTDGTLIGYASLRLTARGNSTLVEYDVFCWMDMPPGLSTPEDKALVLASSHKRFDEELATLKNLAEADLERR